MIRQRRCRRWRQGVVDSGRRLCWARRREKARSSRDDRRKAALDREDGRGSWRAPLLPSERERAPNEERWSVLLLLLVVRVRIVGSKSW